MTGKPDPNRIYIATTGYWNNKLGRNVREGQKLQGNDPLVVAHPQFWMDAAHDLDTKAIVDALAERLAPARRSKSGQRTAIDRLAWLDAAIERQWTAEDPPTQQVVAEKEAKTERWISEIARPGGGYKAAIERVRPTGSSRLVPVLFVV